MRDHRESDSVKSQSCEVTGGELTLAVDQHTIFYNNKDTFLVVGQVEVSYSVRELKHPQKY